MGFADGQGEAGEFFDGFGQKFGDPRRQCRATRLGDLVGGTLGPVAVAIGSDLSDVAQGGEPPAIEQVLAEGRSLEQDVVVTLPDGDVRTFADIRFPIFGPDGQPTAVGEIATDVTELRSAQ